MALSPKEMHERILSNLLEKTGRDAGTWLALIRDAGPASRRDRTNWLKAEHGLGHGTATTLACEADGNGWGTDGDLLAALFADPEVRHRYDELAASVKALGPDVTVVPCKTYVGFQRRRQFAVVRPRKDGTLEIGVALDDAALPPAKGLGSARINARAPDGDAETFVRRAYDADR